MTVRRDPAVPDRWASATPTAPPMPAGAARCWQVMTGLAIDNRADAIDYLCDADPAVRLSAEALAALLNAIPLLPTTPRRSTHDDAG